MVLRSALCVSSVGLTLVAIIAAFASYVPLQDYIRKIFGIDCKQGKIHFREFKYTLLQEAQTLTITGKTLIFGRSRKFMPKPSRCIAKNCSRTLKMLHNGLSLGYCWISKINMRYACLNCCPHRTNARAPLVVNVLPYSRKQNHCTKLQYRTPHPSRHPAFWSI